MKIVGLTGSIGMGKSETSRMFRENGVRIFDADAAVHQLMATGGAAVEKIETAFPGVKNQEGAIDRTELGKRVFGEEGELKKLEALLHPMVGEMRTDFVRAAEEDRQKMVVFDIPLLFETGGQENCDYVVVVSAPAEVQRTRVLERDGMTEERFLAILEKQTPDEQKRAQADFIVETDKGLDHAQHQVRDIIRTIEEKIDAGNYI